MLRTFVFLLLAGACCAQQTPATSAPDLVKQGEKLNSEGKQDDALALYQKALAMSPNLYEAHLGSGIALDLKANLVEARQHFVKAIEVAPADFKQQALRAMAMSYAFGGNPDEAAKFEKQVIDMRMSAHDYIGAAEIANELARIYLESGNTIDAYKWYKSGYETTERKSDLSDADKNLWVFRWEHAQARIAARRGKADEAQQHVAAARAALDKANNLDQARFFPYLTGYVAFYTGDYKTAIADLQKADQRDPLILALIGESYEKSGDATQAKDYYRKVLASNAHNPTNAFARPLARKKLAEGN
jgi:tetratricopeptide (TPR) repeat protein